jgi:hypothetical protein
MLTFEDYRRMADRSAQLAIACSPPSVSTALMRLASDYMSLAAAKQQQHEMRPDPVAGYGD